VVSRTLKRLQERGLVELIRHSRYIKKICLTAKGKILAEKMNKTTGLNDSGK
jgi:DNA-binding MarR family transcriptional regulator